MCGRVHLQLHTFLIPPLDRGGWSASCSVRILSEVRSWYSLVERLGELSLDVVRKRKPPPFPCPTVPTVITRPTGNLHKANFKICSTQHDCLLLRVSVTHSLILSRDTGIIDGVWIGNRIYWTLTTRNYKYTLHKSLQDTFGLLSLLQSSLAVAW
jgi:hypothetical protein